VNLAKYVQQENGSLLYVVDTPTRIVLLVEPAETTKLSSSLALAKPLQTFTYATITQLLVLLQIIA